MKMNEGREDDTKTTRMTNVFVSGNGTDAGRRHDLGDRHAAAGRKHLVARQTRLRRRLLPLRVRTDHWR